ncbi:MAG: ABC transporter permease [Caldilineaceae bacterium]|nr:ABC transporter permease [Caldilineaceae bacterium]
MRTYLLQRILQAIPILIGISIISFVIIQLPPGDYLTTYVNNLRSQGDMISDEEVKALEQQYGLDSPVYVQYWKWVSNFMRGNMGQSFYWNKPVRDLIGERIALSIVVALFSLILTYAIAIPVGLYSATRQYTLTDHILTILAFIGVGLPSFLVALVLMYYGMRYFGLNAGGLFSAEYLNAPWSFGRVVDLLKHMWLPALIIGISGTAGTIRVMRATTLDELSRPYVEAARARGLDEATTVLRYPARVALNPIMSTIGWQLPAIVSGETIVSLVLGLPTCGPLLYTALITQDMYLAASFIMILSALTVIGTLISDLLLMWIDPRIRFGELQ